MDGDEQEIHPQMNYRLRVPQIVDSQIKVYEIYEITDFSLNEYRFLGYEE